MQIGVYHIDNNLVLAPMAGITDQPFRNLCRRFGAGLAVSEMVSANNALWKTPKTLHRIKHEGEIAPYSVQIAGAEPALMAEAARFNVAHGAQLIDINMGCPAKKVCNKLAGSALLQHESLVKRILDAVVAAVDVPVTLKIRTGWDHQQRNAVRIAHIAEQAGIQALAIHGRTRADAYQGEAEYTTIAAVKQTVNIPIIANGDINSPQKAAVVLKQTGVDGLMIGRASRGNPWIFREILHYFRTGQRLPAPSLEEIRTVVLAHLTAMYAFYGEQRGVRMARKHIVWYCKKLPNNKAFLKQINQVDAAALQFKLVEVFLQTQ